MADALGGQGEIFALRAAARVRRRRLLARVAAPAGVAAAIMGLLCLARNPAPRPAPPLPPGAATSVVEIISDQELLAELKDQPVLILRDQSRITGVIFLADQTGKNL